jgi:hypothetical protein
MKDVEKRVIVKDVDRCSIWTVARGPGLLIKLISINRIKKRTSAIGTCHSLYLGLLFLWIEGKR